MWRCIHSFVGLWGMGLLTLLSLTGAILSVYPLIESFSTASSTTPTNSVADLLDKVSLDLNSIETLVRKPSGELIASYNDANDTPRQVTLDANTGAALGQALPSGPLYSFVKELHRSLFLADAGRAVSGLGAFIMVILCLGGILLLSKRMGGMKRLFSKTKGHGYQRFHTLLARVVALPLLLSSLSGIYLVLTDFDVISITNAESIEYPQSREGLPAVAVSTLQALAQIPLDQLVELEFPLPDDPTDVLVATTSNGVFSIDQFSGEVLEFVPVTKSEIIFQWFYALHTGEGLVLVGVFLGFIALSVPLMGFTGVVMRRQRLQGSHRTIKNNDKAEEADIIVLVGSEGGATWEFARSLHRDLSAVGLGVHVATMNAFRNRYHNAQHVLFLTSTYGNGCAPESAQRFNAISAKVDSTPDWNYAVLGFGDRAFPNYCQFAKTLDRDLQNKGWRRSMETSFVNRQSTQAFTHWGADLAKVLGLPLHLSHQVTLPKTEVLTLIEQRLYGEHTEAATAILRFRSAGLTSVGNERRFFKNQKTAHRFIPGDLLGILPPDSRIPRYYSIASKPSDTEVEICVKHQKMGECSSYLHNLSVGDSINYFNRANTGFQPVAGSKPIIMVSAGTGIAPFMGMIRANDKQRAIHLFWGGRDPNVDYLYQPELELCEKKKHITDRHIAFSRVDKGCYVQTKISENAVRLYELIRQGASIMVCGGEAMAQSVSKEFNEILRPMGLSTVELKARGQYLEDIF